METERFNGVKLNLGEMSLAELQTLRGYVEERLEQAQRELQVLREYISEREVRTVVGAIALENGLYE